MPTQLGQDRRGAEREGLAIELIEGDTRDLSALADASFELIVHPCSNCFIPNLREVWSECYRVLEGGGTLLTGFLKPEYFLLDFAKYEKDQLEVRRPLPYSDLDSLSEAERQALIDANEPLCFSHTLESQIGGQIAAGFAIAGLYEDRREEASDDVLSKYMATFVATRATKSSG